MLIYDGEGRELLLPFLEQWNPETLHVRGERLNIPLVLASLGSGRDFWKTYTDNFVRAVSPRVVVTFIDNNVAFYSLSARHPGVVTMFVQNGTRSIYGDVFGELRQRTGGEPLRVDRMLTFGADVGAEYGKHIAGERIACGSLKNNSAPRQTPGAKGTIAFISQFRESEGPVIAGRSYSRKEYFQEPDELVLGFLADYARRRGKTLSVISCARDSTGASAIAERRYFETLAGPDCGVSGDLASNSGYAMTDAADVVVSIDSTLGYESVARGNRTALFTVRVSDQGESGLQFGWPGNYPDDGPFWTNRRDPDAFERILDHLFGISDEEFMSEAASCGFERIMAYDPGNTILKDTLQELLGDRETSKVPKPQLQANVQ